MKLLLLLMCVLEIADGLFTEQAVGEGLAREANQLMESIIIAGDFLLLKVVGAVVCSIGLWLVYKRFPRLAVSTTSGIVLFYSAVMVWNAGVFTSI